MSDSDLDNNQPDQSVDDYDDSGSSISDSDDSKNMAHVQNDISDAPVTLGRKRGRPRKTPVDQPLHTNSTLPVPKIPKKFPVWLPQIGEYYHEEFSRPMSFHQSMELMKSKWAELTECKTREQASAPTPDVKARNLIQTQQKLKEDIQMLEEEEEDDSASQNNSINHHEARDFEENPKIASPRDDNDADSVQDMEHADDDDDDFKAKKSSTSKKSNNSSLKMKKRAKLTAKLLRNSARLEELKSSVDHVTQQDIDQLIQSTLFAAPEPLDLPVNIDLDSSQPVPSLRQIVPNVDLPPTISNFDSALSRGDTASIVDRIETQALDQTQFYFQNAQLELKKHGKSIKLPLTTHSLQQLKTLLKVVIPAYSHVKEMTHHHQRPFKVPMPLQASKHATTTTNTEFEDGHTVDRFLSRKALKRGRGRPKKAMTSSANIEADEQSPLQNTQPEIIDTMAQISSSSHRRRQVRRGELFDISLSQASINSLDHSTTSLGILWNDDGSAVPK